MKSFNYKKFIDAVWFERRDIVSDGYDRALNNIQRILSRMDIHRYPSGTEAWTWIIPKKWSVRRAHIRAGRRVLLDLKDHPLHVMSYSLPISGKVSRRELMKHLYSRPNCPDAIPFEFSYYEPKWGFCIQHRRLPEFTAKAYDVLIDSVFEDGDLKVGSLCVPGATDEEIVLMAHLCHPCMVDDDLSGVAVLVKLALRMLARSRPRYTYRFLFLPETIGSIAFLSHNEQLIPKIKYGIFLEMLGHEDQLSLQKSKQDDTRLDRAAQLALRERGKTFRVGKFHEVIGNDEKVFNGPGVNIPTISISRSKFWGRGEWPYPEYHSSADRPDIVSEGRLIEAEKLVLRILELMDRDFVPLANVKGPICLSRYHLWVDWRKDRELNAKQAAVLDHLAGGERSIIDMAYELDLPFDLLQDWLEKFSSHNLIEKKRV